MAEDTTKLVISVETLLKGLDKTLAGLAKVEAQLKRIAAFKPTQSAAAADKAAVAAQRLANQQQKLSLQAQELANRQDRARLAADRLALSQLRLEQAFQRTAVAGDKIAKSTGKQADAHVKDFKAIQRATKDADHHVRAFRASQEALRRAPQLDAHVRAFRAIQRGAEDANHHVQAFRAHQAALAKAPPLDAHVQAFRRIQAETAKANQQLIAFGNAARSIGQGLASLGATLTVTLTAPLTALGAATVSAGVQLDSLKRGLTAIVGSSAEAGRQLTRLTQLAKLPGIGFEEAIQGSIRLQAVGFSAREAERNLREFANAVALTGGGREELSRITVQLGQLAAKGKVLSQDLRPIIEAAPAVGRALKQAFGTVNADDIAELTGSSKEFLNVLVAELERLPRAAAGAKNAFENFRDTLFRAAAVIGETILPALTELVQLLGPVITGLAKVFQSLPGPVQAVIVGLTALLAIAGPLVFILGQLVLGIGRVVVGVIQVNAALPPTIAGLFGLATGANAATSAMAALRVALIATGVGLVAVAVQIGIAILAYKAFAETQKEAAEINEQEVSERNQRIASLRNEVSFLESLVGKVQRTADEERRLTEIYKDLNDEGKARNEFIRTEKEQLDALIESKRRQLEVDEFIARGTIAQAIDDINKALNDQFEAQQRVNKAREDEKQAAANVGALIADAQALVSEEERRVLVLGLLRQAQAEGTQAELDLNKARVEAGRLLTVLARITGRSTEQLLEWLRSLGLTPEALDDARKSLDAYTKTQEEAAAATDNLTDATRRQNAEFDKAVTQAQKVDQAERALISGRVLLAKRTAGDVDAAVKKMREFMAAQPELSLAIRNQAFIARQSVDEFLRQLIGGSGAGAERAATALRSAQEQFNDAMDRLQQEAKEKTIAEEQSKNDQLLRINELRFARELKSFQQFVVDRANIQRQQIQGEITRQQKIIELAKGDVKRARETAEKTTGTEQVRARADEKKALAEQIQAETKIIELRSRQKDITLETTKELDQFTQERLRSFRELSRELDEITGKELEAAEAAIDERFVEQLRQLRTELEAASREFEAAKKAGRREAAFEAQATAENLALQIKTIENHKRELKAVAEVQEVQELIRRAKEEQANLERRLTFEVEFRGLAEEEAIRQRLEGEAKVREAIDQQRVRLEVLAATLKAAGLEIPLALAEAIEQLKVASLGLGELDFVEQFRLAQKEFDRLNDLRIRKIQEVERAVAHRDISELQGRIAIKAANGEYIGALEEQLRLLQQIAEASGDEGLKQQAADMEATTKEVENATTEIADLDKAIQSVSIDALHDSFSGFLDSLRHGADAAKEALLDMLDSVISRVNQIIADRLFEQLFGSFLKPVAPVVAGPGAGGLGTAVAGGVAPLGQAGQAAGQAGAAALTTAGTTAGAALTTAGTTAAAALTTGGTTAGAALTTGATTASAALVTGATTASASFLTGVTTAGAGFLATVAAAGAAFAAAVAAAAAADAAIGGIGAAAGAATGIYPAVPGGVVRIVEGGYPEAVLTTDPKHAARQVSILREYLRQTKGLFGRLPQLAEGGMVSAREMEADFLRSLSPGLSTPTPSSDMQLQSAATQFNLRNINLIDRGALVGTYLRSAEGTRDILNTISTERDEVGRRIGVRF